MSEGSENSSEIGTHQAGILHYLVSGAKRRALKKCLQAGMNPNAQDYNGRTGLHIAATLGKLDMLQILIDYGGNGKITDRRGRNALDDAIDMGHRNCENLLRAQGISPTIHSKDHIEAPKPLDSTSRISQLLQAAADGDENKLIEILDHDSSVNIDSRDYDGRTAAHLAASEGKLEILKILISRGANLNIMDRYGDRCLNNALNGGHLECSSLLRRHGAEMSLIGDGLVADPKQTKTKTQTFLDLQKRGIREFWALDKDDFVMEDTPFARGAGGEIYLATWRDLKVAAKTCSNLTMTEQTLLDLGNEIALMSTLRHPNVALFYGACFQLSPPVILLEFCPNGNLETKLVHASLDGVKIPEEKKLKYALQLALGMTFLHRCTIPIIHRDLKPSNVLISADDTIKVTDFGLAKYVPIKNKCATDTFTLTGETGSYRFMAPEVFRHEPYNQSVDVYSYALIIYWLYSGYRPFWTISDPVEAVKFASLKKGRPDASIIKHPKIRLLIQQSWSEEPDSRPSFSQIAKFWQELQSIPITQAGKCNVC